MPLLAIAYSSLRNCFILTKPQNKIMKIKKNIELYYKVKGIIPDKHDSIKTCIFCLHLYGV